MSEKQFKLIKPLGTRLGLKDIFIKDTQEDYYYNTKEDVVDLLNELSEENEQLRLELETHKHPLWSTREAERKLSEVTDNLADEVKKNGLLNEELNQLRIENMRLKKRW